MALWSFGGERSLGPPAKGARFNVSFLVGRVPYENRLQQKRIVTLVLTSLLEDLV